MRAHVPRRIAVMHRSEADLVTMEREEGGGGSSVKPAAESERPLAVFLAWSLELEKGRGDIARKLERGKGEFEEVNATIPVTGAKADDRVKRRASDKNFRAGTIA